MYSQNYSKQAIRLIFLVALGGLGGLWLSLLGLLASMPEMQQRMYCTTIAKQHRQHRNAVAALSRELDNQTSEYDFGYERSSVALSDAMYASIKRDNNCR